MSVAFSGVKLAERVFGNLKDHRALILGAGAVAEQVVDHLRNRGIRGLRVVNRSRRVARRCTRLSIAVVRRRLGGVGRGGVGCRGRWARGVPTGSARRRDRARVGCRRLRGVAERMRRVRRGGRPGFCSTICGRPGRVARRCPDVRVCEPFPCTARGSWSVGRRGVGCRRAATPDTAESTG